MFLSPPSSPTLPCPRLVSPSLHASPPAQAISTRLCVVIVVFVVYTFHFTIPKQLSNMTRITYKQTTLISSHARRLVLEQQRKKLVHRARASQHNGEARRRHTHTPLRHTRNQSNTPSVFYKIASKMSATERDEYSEQLHLAAAMSASNADVDLQTSLLNFCSASNETKPNDEDAEVTYLYTHSPAPSSPPHRGRHYFVLVEHRWLRGTIVRINPEDKTIRFRLAYRRSMDWDIDTFTAFSMQTDIFKWQDEVPDMVIQDGQLVPRSAPLPWHRTSRVAYRDENPELNRAIQERERDYFPTQEGYNTWVRNIRQRGL